jgi:hypothetical protein
MRRALLSCRVLPMYAGLKRKLRFSASHDVVQKSASGKFAANRRGGSCRVMDLTPEKRTARKLFSLRAARWTVWD